MYSIATNGTVTMIAFALTLLSLPSMVSLTQAGAAPPQATAVTTAPSPAEIIVPRGTEIALLTTTPLSSEKNAKGDIVRMKVARDVIIGGVTVIPQGAEAVGELTRAEHKGAFGTSGKLEARMLYVIVDGSTYRLGGIISVTGRGGTTEAIATGIAVGTLAFVVTGRRAEIAAGTSVTAFSTAMLTYRREPRHPADEGELAMVQERTELMSLRSDQSRPHRSGQSLNECPQ